MTKLVSVNMFMWTQSYHGLSRKWATWWQIIKHG